MKKNVIKNTKHRADKKQKEMKDKKEKNQELNFVPTKKIVSKNLKIKKLVKQSTNNALKKKRKKSVVK